MSSQYKKTIVLGLDYSDFSGGISECNRKMSLLESEFKLASEQAKNYGESTDQLRLKKEALSQKIALQSKIVEEHKKAYDKALSSGTATEKQVDSLDKKLLDAKTTLERLNGEYSKASSELDTYSEAQKNAGKHTDDSNKVQSSFGDMIREVSGFLGLNASPAIEAFASKFDGLDKNVGVAILTIGALATKLYDCSKAAAAYADNILTLSSITGLATDTLQELDYAAELLDVSTEQISSSMSKMVKNMASARDGNKELQKEFASLGVRYKEHNGELRNAEEVFYDLIDALGKMQNETERDAKSMKILGKSAKELNPLIEAGSERFRELGKEAQALGYVMSEGELSKLGSLDDAMQRLNKSSEGLTNTFGLALAPVLTAVFDALAKIPLPVIQSVTAFASVLGGVLLVVKAIKSLTSTGKGLIDFFSGLDVKTIKTTAIIMGVVIALIALGAIIATIIGKGDDLQNTMNSIGNNVGSLNTSINKAQNPSYYASGTDSASGGWAWKGEHGPELEWTPPGSKIINTEDSKKLAGTSNVFYVTIDAKNVKDFNDVVSLAMRGKVSARAGRVLI